MKVRKKVENPSTTRIQTVINNGNSIIFINSHFCDFQDVALAGSGSGSVSCAFQQHSHSRYVQNSINYVHLG